MSGGKKVGSLVRLSITNSEATVSPLLGRRIRAPVSDGETPRVAPTELNCVAPLFGPVKVTASAAEEPFGPETLAVTSAPRPETSVNIRLVRKFDPKTAAEKTSIPFMVKP